MATDFDLDKWANSDLDLDECRYDYNSGMLKGREEGFLKALELVEALTGDGSEPYLYTTTIKDFINKLKARG